MIQKVWEGPYIAQFTKMWNVCLLYNIDITLYLNETTLDSLDNISVFLIFFKVR